MYYKFTPYSVSKIECFEQCPMKFKFIYIDKIKVKSKQYHLQKGKTWHKLIELKLFNKIKEYKNHNYLEYTIKEFYKDLPKIKKLFKSDNFKYFYNYKNIICEQYFVIDKDLNCYFTDIPKENILLKGYIDYIGYNDNKLDIIDWKTGGKSKESILKYPKSFFQLNIYQYVCSKIFNNKNIKSGYFYIEHDLLVKNENFNLNITEESFLDKIDKIENAKFFNKNESALCYWCDYRTICEVTKDEI
jgi:RecB family exonuclease